MDAALNPAAQEVRIGHLRSYCCAFVNATIKPSKQFANRSIDWFERAANPHMVQATWPICRNGDCKNAFHGAREFYSAAESPSAFPKRTALHKLALDHVHMLHQVA